MSDHVHTRCGGDPWPDDEFITEQAVGTFCLKACEDKPASECRPLTRSKDLVPGMRVYVPYPFGVQREGHIIHARMEVRPVSLKHDLWTAHAIDGEGNIVHSWRPLLVFTERLGWEASGWHHAKALERVARALS